LVLTCLPEHFFDLCYACFEFEDECLAFELLVGFVGHLVVQDLVVDEVGRTNTELGLLCIHQTQFVLRHFSDIFGNQQVTQFDFPL